MFRYVAFSFGEAFFTDDPRIGTGSTPRYASQHGTLVSIGRQ